MYMYMYSVRVHIHVHCTGTCTCTGLGIGEKGQETSLETGINDSVHMCNYCMYSGCV